MLPLGPVEAGTKDMEFRFAYRALRDARPSRLPVPLCACCRPTAPTSIRSNRSSPSSELLRSQALRTVKALWRGLGSIIACFTPTEVHQLLPQLRLFPFQGESALATVRRELWTPRSFETSSQQLDIAKNCGNTLNRLIDVACYAA